MNNCAFTLLLSILLQTSAAQPISIELNQHWQFKNQYETGWYKATVPGTVHTDLLANRLIPDPYYRDNETKLQWIDNTNWEYQTHFDITGEIMAKNIIDLVFDGLDTYADVYLNDKLILQANNMFRGWRVDVRRMIKRTNNKLFIRFYSAQKKADSMARANLPLVLPDNNRVYVRKAQFQFGWDWGPKLIGSGIWKKIKLEAADSPARRTAAKRSNQVKLVEQPDSVGKSFYFEKNGRPVYCKGANWIPADVFLPRVTKSEYRKLLLMAKEVNMNMLRVWGGGVYESDDFYDLCDSLDIMVWQDFMFAGGMYPGDDSFMNNVREEVKYQVNRLKKHPCIVLWCGNNEIDEAWHNWGWQNQFNLHGDDSIRVWHDYQRLFRDSLKKWVADFDSTRPYISTSPKFGWGRKQSLTEGDSHYWGVWWGLEDWEVFENKTGRFISEYGMQAMPNWNTVKSYTDSSDRYLFSPVILSHQKAGEGFKKLNHYINRYFFDTLKLSLLSLEDYTYLTQCLQHYVLKNSIAAHRSKYPINMGTLLWQFNDCWPVTSWSITDYYRQPKAAWYAVKKAYEDDMITEKELVYPKDQKLLKPNFTIEYIDIDFFAITANVDASYVYLFVEDGNLTLNDNYFSLKAGEKKVLQITNKNHKLTDITNLKVKSLYDILAK